jgi:hypothetical protein
MSTAEIKFNLYQLISSINDSASLDAAYKLLLKTKKSKVDFWDELSNAEKTAIEIGIAQADRGELVSHESVMAKVNKKFKL